MFSIRIFGMLLSAVLAVNALALPPSHIQNDVVDKYEQDNSQLIDNFDLPNNPFDSITLLRDIASQELESSYYAIDFERSNNSTIECIKEKVTILKEVIENAKQQLQQCLQEGAEGYGDAIQPVQEVREKIRHQIEEGKEIIRNCVAENDGDVIRIIKCVEKKGEPVREALIKLAKELKDELHKAEAAVAAVIENTKQCLRTVVEAAIPVIQNIKAEIKECLANAPAE